MRLQWHPANARQNVRTWELHPNREISFMLALTIFATLLVAFPYTSSVVVSRARREAAEREATVLNARRREAVAVATSGLDETADRLTADRQLLARTAFLYDAIPLARDLSAANAPTGSPEDRLAGIENQLELLLPAVGSLESIEEKHPDWPDLTPAVAPLPESSFVIATEFGWSFSKLTGHSEFDAGVELAAPEGRSVFAVADGVVRWAGRFPFRAGERYSHDGRLVAIRHGDRAVTVYGDLATISVSKGSRVRRGESIGTVGRNPWLNVPRLTFEAWRLSGPEPVPIDPRIVMLDDRSAEAGEALRKYLAARPRGFPPLPREFQ